MSTSSFGPSALATPANAITMARVVALPVVVLLIVGTDTQWQALGLWFVLSVSDLADGWLARRQGATRSGAFLDPLADKVLVLGAMTALVATGSMWWVPVSLIATREVAVSAYRSYVGRRGISVPARMSGKVKTWVQAIAVALAIVPSSSDAYRAVVDGVLWTAVAMTVVTGVQYLHEGRQVVRAL
ncbi:MAG: CDP-diacylglycerol---glycerol-3-phosphate 3-phosphatidyltransferase [Actinomycetota bacterium]|nr:CDP-diacylglycerol---glycerol-3-phosphate 3-phosphatidyltransferase [Actinomycetota bacterium]